MANLFIIYLNFYKKFINEINKLTSFILTLLIFLLITNISALANEPIYAEENIHTLKNIYKYSNNFVYLAWNFEDPKSIHEVIYE